MNYKNELNKIYRCTPPLYPKNFLKKDLILYGAGSFGRMALDLLKKANIKPKFIVDKKIKGRINYTKVISPDELSPTDKEDVLFLVCISTLPYSEINSYLTSLDMKNILHFYSWAYLEIPHLLSNGWNCFNLTENEKIEIEKVCESLTHDEISICHYLQFLWWKLREKEVVFENAPVLSGRKFFKSPIVPKLKNDEILVDCGAHFGQTIEDFLQKSGGEYQKIYAFEPDLENLKICQEIFNNEKIIYSSTAVYSENKVVNFQSGLGFASKIAEDGDKQVKAITIDSLNIEPTIIKLHIEGDELRALCGATDTIKNKRPILMVLADHNHDGLYKIADFINKLCNYKLYFNLHDYCGNSAVFYGIPKERLK